jgi:hypothetical protein
MTHRQSTSHKASPWTMLASIFETVFTHSQLYVALSRATDVRNVSILIKESNVEEVTDNVVYPDALQALQR